MTQGIEITNSWQNISAALSLAAGTTYAAQNVGAASIETFTAASAPDADARGFLLAEGEGQPYTQADGQNLYARCREAPGRSYMVFDS